MNVTMLEGRCTAGFQSRPMSESGQTGCLAISAQRP